MVKDDIKNGMSFLIEEGYKYYKIANCIYRKRIGSMEFICSVDNFFVNYDNDLRHVERATHKLRDIMTVYDADDNIIWRRQEINWHALPVDTKLLVKHPKDKIWKRRYYAGVYDEAKGLVYCYQDGKTSWVDKMVIYGWREDNVRLWSEEEDNNE